MVISNGSVAQMAERFCEIEEARISEFLRTTNNNERGGEPDSRVLQVMGVSAPDSQAV